MIYYHPNVFSQQKLNVTVRAHVLQFRVTNNCGFTDQIYATYIILQKQVPSYLRQMLSQR